MSISTDPGEGQTEQPENEAAMRKGRRQLLMIMGIAMVTLGGSYLLFYLSSGTGGWGTTNHGTFVQPPLHTDDLGWQIAADEQRHWWLWVVSEDQCHAACQQKVKDMRALQILISREAGRVRRGVVAKTGIVPQLDEAFPKLARLDLAGRQQLQEGVYIVDPLGNVVFHYNMEMDPKFILQDLKKMLKVSQIG